MHGDNGGIVDARPISCFKLLGELENASIGQPSMTRLLAVAVPAPAAYLHTTAVTSKNMAAMIVKHQDGKEIASVNPIRRRRQATGMDGIHRP